MKIYTRTGDKGQTSLIGGTRVPKHHIRIEAYGTVDELNSWIGVIRDTANDKAISEHLIAIQNTLFTIGSHLANDPDKSKMKLPEITEAEVKSLEDAIDAMDAQLEPMKHFVLPGGHIAVSNCHVARCVCRRAERCIIHLGETAPVEEIIIRYINRLSDYLFTLSRMLTVNFGATEIPWVPAR
jgi:cob(I)alamin adenosyltransferase